MAKATVIIKCEICGEEFTHTKICNSRKEADSYEEWAEQNITICPKCYKEEQQKKAEEKAKKSAEGVNLVNLEGSEKQIVWATKIRNETVGEAKKFSELYDESAELLQILIDGINQKTESKWWIENRYEFSDYTNLVKAFAPQILAE